MLGVSGCQSTCIHSKSYLANSYPTPSRTLTNSYLLRTRTQTISYPIPTTQTTYACRLYDSCYQRC